MRYALISALLFVGTVFAANWAITEYGLVPVGFGRRIRPASTSPA